MDEEVKGFNRYMSKVDFQPVTGIYISKWTVDRL